ncbi:MAG: hypothetical protein Q8O04_12100 [Deltaproteobacteria bacterium]|nr:hypothetical protein [Deltaproteobacteria bacterium]
MSCDNTTTKPAVPVSAEVTELQQLREENARLKTLLITGEG